MKLLVLYLALAATIAHCNAGTGEAELSTKVLDSFLGSQKWTKAALFKFGKTLQASAGENGELSMKILEVVFELMCNYYLGSGRASRSSVVGIINLTDKAFLLDQTSCNWGGYSSDAFPQPILHGGNQSVYGIESTNYMTGVICDTKYVSRDGSWFKVTVDNPVFGGNGALQSSSIDLHVVTTLGTGFKNKVVFVVRDKF